MEFDKPYDINILYKYRYFDSDGNHLKTIANNEFYFSSRQKLNDPFDLSLRPNYEVTTPTKLKGNILKLERKIIENPHLYPYITINDAKKRIKEMLYDVDHNYKKAFDDFIFSNENPINFYGICSFSADIWNDILMWSHYSDSHKGFCVGLNYRELTGYLNYLHLYNKNNPAKSGLFKVNYVEEYPIIDPFESEDKFINIMITKYERWRYEQEYRLIHIDGNNKSFILPDEVLEEVIIGLNCEPENIKKIIEILKSKSKKLKLYKIVQKPKSFELSREEINY